jgi:S-DNA-T family DNA segregation ATPase FtsK/SpoIIIE
VAGPGGAPRAAGRWLVAQVAALHSPEDVQVCVLTGASGQAAWEWVRALLNPGDGTLVTITVPTGLLRP